MQPRNLAPNVFEHQYRGGAQLATLRGLSGLSEYSPEEWLGATNGMFADVNRGLARTETGELLRDLVATDPTGWFGSTFTPTYAGDSGVLFKLLDAGQRLPVHVHPDRAFAREHLHCNYGKTEAWLVLDSAPGSSFHLGWKTGVDRTELALRRDAQDSAWMLDHMHSIPAKRGLSVVVPAGWMHSIDEGIFLAEIQEPTDFSISFEWSVTTLSRDEVNLDLGWRRAERAATLTSISDGELSSVIRQVDLDAPAAGVRSLLSPTADPFFRLQQAVARPGRSSRVTSGFGIAMVLSGSGAMTGTSGSTALGPGSVVAVPAAFGDWDLSGDIHLLLARPADPEGLHT